MCVTLLVCLSNTRHNASKKLLAKQQVDGNTEEEGKRERGRVRVRGVACLGALQNNLNCHCKVGSAQRFACWGGIKKVCLVLLCTAAALAAITFPAYCYFRKQ